MPHTRTGMDWTDLETLIREERRAGNPVASLVHSLQLSDNGVTLLLANTLDGEGEEGDEEANTRKAVKVGIAPATRSPTRRDLCRLGWRDASCCVPGGEEGFSMGGLELLSTPCVPYVFLPELLPDDLCPRSAP